MIAETLERFGSRLSVVNNAGFGRLDGWRTRPRQDIQALST